MSGRRFPECGLTPKQSRDPGIRLFFDLPDPLVIGMDRIRILPFSHTGVERIEIMLAKYNFNIKIIFKAVD
jgi:hypothetical protein